MRCNPGERGPGCSGLDAAPPPVQAASGTGAPAAPGARYPRLTGSAGLPAPRLPTPPAPRRRRPRPAGSVTRCPGNRGAARPRPRAGRAAYAVFPVQTNASLGLPGLPPPRSFFFLFQPTCPAKLVFLFIKKGNDSTSFPTVVTIRIGDHRFIKCEHSRTSFRSSEKIPHNLPHQRFSQEGSFQRLISCPLVQYKKDYR